MDFNLGELIVVSPLIILFLTSIVPISYKAFNNGKEMSPFKAMAWCMVGLVGAAGLTLSAVNGFWKISGLNAVEVFSKSLIIDGITVWSCYIIYVVVGFCLLMLYDSRATRDRQFSEHLFLIMNATIGMSLVVMAANLLVTFISIELMSLSAYLLIALNKEKVLSKEASFKYFVLGGLGSAILLYGIAFVYGGTGSTHLSTIGEVGAQLYHTNNLFRFGVVMTIIGFAFKVSLVPFHSWTPDVYQGSATPVTSIMATSMKVASFIAFLRFFLYADFYDVPSERFLMFMQWLAALTMIVGNIAAIKQDNFKRMLAYSSIAHSGYILMGLIAASFGNDNDGGVSSMIFYLLSYSVMTVGTLGMVVVFEKTEKTILLIDDLKGLAKKTPYAFVESSPSAL